MPSNPKIRALARQAALKIKTLTEAHQIQIEAIYLGFRQQAAELQESNGDSLAGFTATPVQPTEIDRSENNYA